MAGCILRAEGHFSPDSFLARHAFASEVLHRRTSLVVEVSAADGDALPAQIADALAFIERESAPLQALRAFDGVEVVSLNFGLWQAAAPAQIVAFPVELVAAAAALGIELRACLYAVDAAAERSDT